MENKSLNVLFPKLRVFCDHVPDKIQNVIHAVSFVFLLNRFSIHNLSWHLQKLLLIPTMLPY